MAGTVALAALFCPPSTQTQTIGEMTAEFKQDSNRIHLGSAPRGVAVSTKHIVFTVADELMSLVKFLNRYCDLQTGKVQLFGASDEKSGEASSTHTEYVRHISRQGSEFYWLREPRVVPKTEASDPHATDDVSNNVRKRKRSPKPLRGGAGHASATASKIGITPADQHNKKAEAAYEIDSPDQRTSASGSKQKASRDTSRPKNAASATRNVTTTSAAAISAPEVAQSRVARGTVPPRQANIRASSPSGTAKLREPGGAVTSPWGGTTANSQTTLPNPKESHVASGTSAMSNPTAQTAEPPRPKPIPARKPDGDVYFRRQRDHTLTKFSTPAAATRSSQSNKPNKPPAAAP
ncbi:hypothetical protein P389DRAFT_198980 [Cystobasidium minutum MCA 4210]|uniref:uncharacterized protein n=1 Tax=Cystobasidium minutum MCA 4210 TaxID=1397322 RepID=UPI0034CE9AE2|eukprot:jgi/Rhomi1/198980/gm1.7194_g